ncbi:hypothetical protein [Methylobacterium sp. ID0610]|uniref:hypothetical protein n=1 Tax=Methylobacterium carpenticola TaxID=3344827 RepID=UPI00369922E0
MTLEAQCQPVFVNTGAGGEPGSLVFVGGKLVAVLVQLDESEDNDRDLQGKWFLEAGFGPCQDWSKGSVFTSQDEAVAWVSEQVRLDRFAAA